MIYTSRPPKNTTARLAWDKYVQKYQRCPESVYYTSNYKYQYKGWICEHDIKDILVKHMNYGGSTNYVFYESIDLVTNKIEIEKFEYKEQKKVTIKEISMPTEVEIKLYMELNNQFMDMVKELYIKGTKLFDAREAVLSSFGVTSINQYFINNGCNVVPNNSPNNPVVYQYRKYEN